MRLRINYGNGTVSADHYSRASVERELDGFRIANLEHVESMTVQRYIGDGEWETLPDKVQP